MGNPIRMKKDATLEREGGREEVNNMTGKGKDILDKAEDVILRKLEEYLNQPEKLSDKDIYDLQILVITTGRIQGIRKGKVHEVAAY